MEARVEDILSKDQPFLIELVCGGVCAPAELVDMAGGMIFGQEEAEDELSFVWPLPPQKEDTAASCCCQEEGRRCTKKKKKKMKKETSKTEILAWSNALKGVVSFSCLPKSNQSSTLIDFFRDFCFEDEFALRLLKEGIAVKLYTERSRRRVMMLKDKTLKLCLDQGQVLSETHSLHLDDIHYICLGPGTLQLQRAIQKEHGDFLAPDAMTQGKRCFSLLAHRAECFDLEVLDDAKPQKDHKAAQRLALLVARVLFKMTTRTTKTIKDPGRTLSAYTHLLASPIIPLNPEQKLDHDLLLPYIHPGSSIIQPKADATHMKRQ